jgi:hypothetical protein
MMYPVITIPPELIERCREYANRVCAGYDRGLNQRSAKLTLNDIAHDPLTQTMSRVAECAFCLFVDISVELLNWTDYCDNGLDCPWDRLTYDVKSTAWDDRHNNLIYSAAKTHFYDEMPFDRLIMIKVAMPHCRYCQVRGWVDKDVFLLRHELAPQGHFLLPGTWYMHQRLLEDPQILVSWRDYRAAQRALRENLF